jgi:hypothetical protein
MGKRRKAQKWLMRECRRPGIKQLKKDLASRYLMTPFEAIKALKKAGKLREVK